MAFKDIPPPQNAPDSPEKILLDLPRRKIPGVLLHQGEIMKAYATHALSVRDVALQLPTGSGKTLVGLMIGEWRRRKFRERVVYLCPTRQLVNQVVEQAEQQYGLTVHGFTGSASSYHPTAKSEYQNADRLAVTTYSALFNTNPFFDSAQTIIVDDAHAAENYIAALWTLRIERSRPEHQALHSAVAAVLQSRLDSVDYTRVTGKWESVSDLAWVEKIPTPDFASIRDELIAVIDAHVGNIDLRFPWSMIRTHLHACHLYLTSQDILLRPLIPPTWTHAAFENATQRIFMSATLGAGGDLERLTGRRSILRLPVPEGWDRQGIGRRFFVFPGMALNEDDAVTLRTELMRRAGRSLVLVPSDRAKQEIVADVKSRLGFKLFEAEDIEESKQAFVSAQNAVAVVANRYDGIDFPGDDCRLLFIDGLPRAVNAQERFLMSRMGANVLFNERVQTRVLQAIGRCTRSLQDFSAVIVSGEELPDYLTDRIRRSYLHPELQAELDFGIEQSQGTTLADILDNFNIFLRNGKEWEKANDQILAKRAAANQKALPAIDELHDIVVHEIEFQERLWQGDYESALGAAERVLGGLVAPDLRGYRALWHYLAGSVAWLGGKEGTASLIAKSRLQFSQAKEAARSIPWLVRLSRYQSEPGAVEDNKVLVLGQLERVEALLAQLGKLHDRQYDRKEREILEGLDSTEKVPFENAHRLLGEILGFSAGKKETDGSPDPWWIAGNLCLVFEDHAGASSDSSLDVTKARQAASHPNWIKANVTLAPGSECLAVLVTPVSTVREGAVPHLINVALWPLGEFRSWAKNALAAVRKIRRTFSEPGDLVWRAEAIEVFENNGLDAPSLFGKLKSYQAREHLVSVK
jgi:hypothetical protein